MDRNKPDLLRLSESNGLNFFKETRLKGFHEYFDTQVDVVVDIVSDYGILMKSLLGEKKH